MATTSVVSELSHNLNHYAFDTSGEWIHDEDDGTISIAAAMEALLHSKKLLANAANVFQPWQDAQILLDTTASALDLAGLALRGSSGCLGDEEEEIRSLSNRIIQDRQKVLGAAIKKHTEWNYSIPSTPRENGNKEETTPLVVYASHTGTAKRFAFELAEALNSSNLDKVNCMSMKDVDLQELTRQKRVYFVCSTFGVGRPPRDGDDFFMALQLLRCRTSSSTIISTNPAQDSDDTDISPASLNTDSPLDGLEVAVAALGNSSFENFCAFGFGLSKELRGLGAKELLPPQAMDSSMGRQNMTETFSKWQQSVADFESSRL